MDPGFKKCGVQITVKNCVCVLTPEPQPPRPAHDNTLSRELHLDVNVHFDVHYQRKNECKQEPQVHRSPSPAGRAVGP